MGQMLCFSFEGRDYTEDLVDIFPCRCDEVTLPMLGAAFFERGRLAPSWLNIHPPHTVALGDIGYVPEAGGFVAVHNVHRAFQATSGTFLERAFGVL